MSGFDALSSTDTHGILALPGRTMIASSDGLNWRTLFASRQIEQPFTGCFHARADHLIVLHLSGPVHVERNFSGGRARVKVERGGLFILPAGRDFGVALDAPLETIHTYVRGALLDQAAWEAGFDLANLTIVPGLGVHDPVIEQMGILCCTMLEERQSDFCADAVSRIIAARLVAAHSTARLARTAARAGLSSVQLEAVRDLVHQHIDESITVDSLAVAVGLSPAQFARRFKRTTGRSPYQFVIDERLDLAREMLLRGAPIAEIAAQTGFPHQEHLTRMFGRRFGMTPGRFRTSAMH
jgi:AraC family transcriptional regulator